MALLNHVIEQIEKIKEKCDRIKPLVVIQCFTYNQESFISYALDGFVMQKTDFTFVAIVHDDASTDNTTQIVREYAEKYPDIILPIFEHKNQYSKGDGSHNKIMNAACIATGAKYIAMCEGDDYWIDPLKLQKQVDFLETHPDYGLVHTNFKIYHQNSGEVESNGSKIYHIVNGYVFESLLKGCFIRTATVMSRAELMLNIENINNNMFSGDIFYFLEIARHSKFYFFEEETTIYRHLNNSASHIPDHNKRLIMYKSLEALDNYYISNYNVDKGIVDYVRKKWFVTYLKHYIISKDYTSFKTLQNNGELSILKDPILYTVYSLGKNKYLFNTIIKIKNLLKRDTLSYKNSSGN